MTRQKLPHLPTLPLHLMLTLGCWLSSPFALQCAKSASPLWSGDKNPLSAPLPEALQNAVNQEANSRAFELLSGVLRYLDSPYSRRQSDAPVIWQKGSARLLDYGFNQQINSDRPIVLFVPSLINRYYILDLDEDRSFLKFLSNSGVYPLVLDWGEPGADEVNFGCGDYVAEYLCEAIDFIVQISKQPVTLAGYCMGGLLSLAAQGLRQKSIAALALFATPWDFSCKEFAPFILDHPWQAVLESAIAKRETLPADFILSLFYMTDPWLFEQKFRRFARLPEESRAAQDFIALERWVNDGVAMTSCVAQDCLIGWAQKNQLVKRQWKVGNKFVDPRKLSVPTFIAIPKNDYVVPINCATPLAEAISHAEIIYPRLGHVSMIVGSAAKRELWQPFLDWLMLLPRSP